MDLFGDLPEPATSNCTSGSATLYDDIPITNNTSATKVQEIEKNQINCKRKAEEDDNTKSTRLKTSVKYRLSPFFAERQGERDEMQDEHILMKDITQQIPSLHPSVDGRRCVSRKIIERFKNCCVDEHDRFGGGSVMVWAGISYDGSTDIYVIRNRSLTGVRYRDEILAPIVIMFMLIVIVLIVFPFEILY